MPLGLITWRSSGGTAAKVPADGCADIILRGDRLVVSGPSTQWIATPEDSSGDTIGLRLAPGLAGTVLETTAIELADRAADLEAVVSRRRATELRAVMKSLAKLDRSSDAALDPLGEQLFVPRSRLRIVRLAARANRSAAATAAGLNESERTFRRRMRSDFGYGFATLVRIERAVAARRLLAQGARAADVAARAGYADQAHLTREFRRLVGIAPAQFAGISA